MTEQKPALEAKDVSHSYGELEVLNGLSLSAERGEVHALVGANGSGKTTLLRILAGLLSPDSGTVERRSEGERDVGYLPQKPSFRSGFTAAETVRFYARLLNDTVSEEYVEAALDSVGLPDAYDRPVSGLSGGMTRLLGVAQARIGDPTALILDEPTSGLDPEMTGRIFETAGELADRGDAVLLTTHDLERVGRNADRLSVLDGGVVAESGTPSEVIERHDAEDLSDVFDEVVRGGRR